MKILTALENYSFAQIDIVVGNGNVHKGGNQGNLQ